MVKVGEQRGCAPADRSREVEERRQKEFRRLAWDMLGRTHRKQLTDAAERIEDVRQALLDYDPLTDRRGEGWDGLRVRFDLAMRAAVKLLRVAAGAGL